MAGIFLGSTALTPSFPGLTAVYVGATKVWPLGLPEQGFWQPYPMYQSYWDRWIYKNENFVGISADRMQASLATGASPAYAQTTLVDVSPGVEYTFEVEGYQTPIFDIILTAGTTEYGSEIDSVTVDRTTWGGNRHTIVFTPTTDQVYVGFASAGTPPSFGFIYFVNIGCRPQNWIQPGFSQPYPNVADDEDRWTDIGSTLSVSSSNLQWRVNANYLDAGMSRSVEVTPGVEYIFQVQGGNSNAFANRQIKVGTSIGAEDIGQLSVSGTDWALNSVPIEIVFTPTVSPVWVTAACDGTYSYTNSWMNSPRCEPTGN